MKWRNADSAADKQQLAVFVGNEGVPEGAVDREPQAMAGCRGSAALWLLLAKLRCELVQPAREGGGAHVLDVEG